MSRSEPGRVVAGKYRLIRLLGSGGMGTVFVAEHVQVRRSFALKFVRPDRSTTPRYLRRFEREAELLGRLDHENVVSLHDIGVDSTNGPYLVLEYVRGVTLREELDRHGVRPLDRILAIVEQMARGLTHAHRLGIVHRDLKPENVMLAEHADGSLMVKLLDFGVAGLRGDDGERMTLSDTAIGTAAYMAPEQARGDRALDARTDVYALGVITYEALSGALPYKGDSYNETLFKILHRKHARLEELRPELPEGCVGAVERALSKELDARYGNVEDFARELQGACGERPKAASADPTESTTAEGSAVRRFPAREQGGRLRLTAVLALGAGAGYVAGALQASGDSAQATGEEQRATLLATASVERLEASPATVSEPSSAPPPSDAAEPKVVEPPSRFPVREVPSSGPSQATAPASAKASASASSTPSAPSTPDLGERGYIVNNPYTGHEPGAAEPSP